MSRPAFGPVRPVQSFVPRPRVSYVGGPTAREPGVGYTSHKLLLLLVLLLLVPGMICTGSDQRTGKPVGQSVGQMQNQAEIRRRAWIRHRRQWGAHLGWRLKTRRYTAPVSDFTERKKKKIIIKKCYR